MTWLVLGETPDTKTWICLVLSIVIMVLQLSDIKNMKKVLIEFESGAIGDSIAWIESCEQFRKINNCMSLLIWKEITYLKIHILI